MIEIFTEEEMLIFHRVSLEMVLLTTLQQTKIEIHDDRMRQGTLGTGASNDVQVLTNQEDATPTFQDFEIDLVSYTEREGLDNGMMFREGVITYK